MNKQLVIKLVIAVLIIAGVLIYFRKNQKFNVSDKLLICTGSSANLIDFNDSENVKEYFRDDRLSRLLTIFKTEDDVWYTTYTTDDYYLIIQVKNGEIKEHIKSKQPMYTFAVKPDEYIVLTLEDPETKSSFLYKYDFREQALRKIYSGEVHNRSRPILSSDGSVMFVSIEREGSIIKKYTIKLMSDDEKSLSELASGKQPNWIEEGKILMYSDRERLLSLDLTNGKTRVIRRKIDIQSTPLFSPDRNFIAFTEHTWSTGVPIDVLTIMSVDGRKKRNFYNLRRSSYDSFEWVKR